MGLLPKMAFGVKDAENGIILTEIGAFYPKRVTFWVINPFYPEKWPSKPGNRSINIVRIIGDHNDRSSGPMSRWLK